MPIELYLWFGCGAISSIFIIWNAFNERKNCQNVSLGDISGEIVCAIIAFFMGWFGWCLATAVFVFVNICLGFQWLGDHISFKNPLHKRK